MEVVLSYLAGQCECQDTCGRSFDTAYTYDWCSVSDAEKFEFALDCHSWKTVTLSLSEVQEWIQQDLGSYRFARED